MSGRYNFVIALFGLTSLLITGCANHHFEVVAEGPPSEVPRYVELEKSAQIATLHFPAGEYSFYAKDDVGYYYRSAYKIGEHRGAGPTLWHNGGIYVSKARPVRLRGYVYMAGGLTHVGNLTRAQYEFRD
jgi:hypothetical protein